MAKALKSDKQRYKLICRCGGTIRMIGLVKGGRRPKPMAECTKCGATARKPSDLFAPR